jgi:hypothetical protein
MELNTIEVEENLLNKSYAQEILADIQKQKSLEGLSVNYKNIELEKLNEELLKVNKGDACYQIR